MRRIDFARYCSDCGRETRPSRFHPADGRPVYGGRGRCDACRSAAHRASDRSSRRVRRSELLEELAFLEADLAPRDIAARLGMSWEAYSQALRRARRDGVTA